MRSAICRGNRRALAPPSAECEGVGERAPGGYVPWGGVPGKMAHILLSERGDPTATGEIGNPWTAVPHAITPGRRRLTRTALARAGLVPAPAAVLWLGRGDPPAERAWQIAVRRDHSRGGKPTPDRAVDGGAGDDSLLAGRRGAGEAGMPPS